METKYVHLEAPGNRRFRTIAYLTTLSFVLVASTVLLTTFHNSQRKGTTVEKDDTPLRLVCYYNFPDTWESAIPTPPADLCTHVNVAFATINNNSISLSDENLVVLDHIVQWKQNNENLKILLSVGGAGDEVGFREMVINHVSRKLFVKSAIDLVKTRHIDGVDLDWEFPGRDITGDPRQRQHFTQLMYELRKESDRQKRHKFLITVAVAAPSVIVDRAYDVFYMAKYVDFVNIMTYDYHFFSKITPFTGINAPLFSRPDESGYFGSMNINFTATYWVDLGMDRSKINIGLPTYGHSFSLINAANNGLKAPCRDYGKVGFNGFVGFHELCSFLSTTRKSPVYDEITKSPYVFSDYEWISYDNQVSLSAKAQFVKDGNFGGAMIYSLGSDDPEAVCSNGRVSYPLTKTIKKVLAQRSTKIVI